MASKDLTREITVASDQYSKEENYWLNQLSGELVKRYFPYDFNPDKDGQTRDEAVFNTVKFEIAGELFTTLTALSSGAEKVLHLVLTAGVVLLLNKYSYDAGDDIVVGVPIYKQDIEGDFINTVLALRIQLEGGITFKELLIQVKQVFIAANENQNYPIETLLYLLNIPYSQGDDFPLFDAAVLVEGLHDKKYLRHIHLNTVFSFKRRDEGLEGELEYNASLYRKTTIERIIGLLKQLLQAAVSDIQRPLSALPLTSGEERRRLLFEFNRTDAHYPRDETIHRLFRQQVEKVPGNSAVIYNGETLTYRELNGKVNRLARLLREKGVRADTIVGIMVERSIEMIVGIFAVLKAGGAYLPIDPGTPAQRIAMMLEDARAPMLITTGRDIKGKSWTVLKGIPRVRTRPHLTGRRPQITHLDSLPIPDRSLASYDKYRKYIGFGRVKNCISIQGTRGCPYKCAYCHKIWPKKHVFRSAENLVEEVKLYYDMGIRRFAIIDDIFNVNVGNSSRFYELIIKNGLDVHFFFPTGIRGDILSEDYIDLMVEAGAIDFAVALETASPRLQKLIGKNLDIEKLHRNIEYICKKHPRVILELFTMHGFPSETEEEAMATLEFIKSHRWFHFPYINILRIYLNTDMERLAIAHGISRRSIIEADTLSQHDFSNTLPFDRGFTKMYQSEFLNGYFLNRERLLDVLPHQMKVFTRDELAQRYDSYLPVDIHCFEDFLGFAGIKEGELAINREHVLDEKGIEVPNLDEKIKSHFPVKESAPDALRVLLLDLSQFFKAESSHMLYDVHEPPLGLMTLMTYLNREFGEKINGKVAKSRIDFDTYGELKEILEAFKPDLIGIRTLTFYKEFFHEAAAMIRHWGIGVPIIAGGPYATSDYDTILQDRNVDLVVMGEGESTFTELVDAVLANGGKLPGDDVLKEIKGMAYIPSAPGKSRWETSVSREVLLLDTFPGRAAGDEDPGVPARDPVHINHPGDLAYVIYTSGSTGLPRGVMIRHRSLVNRLNWMQKAYPIDETDVILQKTPFIFDVSVWEIFWWALQGSSVYLLGAGEERNPEAIIEAVEANRVTTMHFVPSMLNAFCGYSDIDGVANAQRLSSLRQVFSSGEALSPHLVETFYRLVNAGGGSRARLINLYGPTEATVDVSYFDCPPRGKPDVVPIGKPIDNIRLYVVNRDFQVQPPGIAGELCIAGDGLARGYLNRPELTAERFIDLPYSPTHPLTHSTIYRTGDLACWLPDGNIEFLGRIDHQVKIRGLRIELEEIETLLLKHRDIKEALVSAREDNYGDRVLCAYIVSGKEIAIPELKDYLARELPDYYIPSHFMQIDAIPLTPSGKADRKALPRVETGGDEYIAPRDRLEEKLAEIWQEVLGLERVSVRDNLFNIGGDSIKTIKLVSAINTQLQTHIKIVDLYANETIEKLARRMKQEIPSGSHEETRVLKEIEELENRVRSQDKLPDAQNIEDIYPMSDIESGMLFHSLKDKGQALYHDQMVYQLKYREFDPERFKRALALMVEKHAILRTFFYPEDFGGPLQVVYKTVAANFAHRDIQGMTIPAQETYLREFLEEDRKNPFKLTEPLWRMRTFACGADIIVAVWVVHHAVMDGWSNAIFLTELNNTYLELKSDPGFVPRQLKNTYRSFVIEQMIEKRTGGVYDYWKRELEGYRRLEIRGSEMRKRGAFDERQVYRHELGAPLAERLKILAGTYESGLKNICFAAYIYMLYMVSYDNDILTGLVVNNRPQVEDGDMLVGCFLNTVPVRIRVPVHITWRDYINFIDGKLLELKKYERLPLFEIARALGEKPDERNPLFDMLFNFIDFYAFQQVNADSDHHAAGSKDGLRSVSGYTNTNMLFDFNVDTTFGRFMLGVSYSRNLVGEAVIRQLCGYFEGILYKFADESEGFAAREEIISSREKEMILYGFNATVSNYPREKTIVDLFEEQAGKTPDAQAVVYEKKALTYRALNERAHHLAGVLRKEGVKPDSAVGIMAGPSLEIIAGILGILKAGGAYLSIDPGYPEERKRYMLEDSQVTVVLGQERFSGTLKRMGSRYNVISLQPGHRDHGGSAGKPGKITHSGNLAYVIYTSGSTGEPKGVMVENRGVVRLVKNTNYIEFTGNTRVLQTGALEFDASTFEIWGALLNGSALYLTDKENISVPARLKETVRDYRINLLWLTSGLFNQLLDADIEIFRGLGTLVIGGDVLSPPRVNKLREKYPHLRVVNGYGPTENTTFSACFLIDKDYDIAIPIGTPISNSRAYILNRHHDLQPPGAVGQLYLAGDGLARGYLNNVEFTAERFIRHPFIHGERIYMTGDLARWLPGGVIEFAGRVDHQVKIRGYRVEPGEIESRLLQIDYIKEAVVMVLENQSEADKSLCAYIVSDGKLDVSMLKNTLSAQLPAYMIPSYFVQLEKIPLTANGKVHRKALPLPGFEAGHNYVAPGNEMQTKLIALWSEVLKVDKNVIGIDDDFFDLGGHSLKAANLAARIHKELNVKIDLAEIFEKPTVRELSQLIAGSEAVEHVSIKPVEKLEYYALSSAQKRLYLVQQLTADSTPYNMYQVIPLKGDIDRQEIEDTFRKLINRHESLRTSFLMAGMETVQVVRAPGDAAFALEYYRISGVPGAGNRYAAAGDFIRPFDLSRAPLLRARLIETGEREFLLMVDMHHIISDGISLNIIRGDFIALLAGQEPSPLPLRYRDYVHWQQSERQEESRAQQEEYWKKEFGDTLPVLNLPTDYKRPVIQSFEGSKLRFALQGKELEIVDKAAESQQATRFMILLAIYCILLARLSGQEDIVVGIPTAGRGHADLENVVGMFVNTLALRNQPAGHKTFLQFLGEVKENSLKAFANQDYPFEDLVGEAAVERDTGRNPIFDVMFAYLNLDEQKKFYARGGISPQLDSPLYEDGISKFDLTWGAIETKDRLICTFEYCTRLFNKGTVRRFIDYLQRIAASVGNDPRQRIADIEILPEAEKERILYGFNRTGAGLPRAKTIHRLVEEQVEKTPGAVALVHKGSHLTYGEFLRRVKRAAGLLRQEGIGPGTIAGIMVERSLEMMTAIFAIMKAGGAYLPVDMGYPPERLNYILEDSGASALVVDSRHPGPHIGIGGRCRPLDLEDLYKYPHPDPAPGDNLDEVVKPGDPIYILYTSGSTGRPKGVLVEHCSVVNMTDGMNDIMDFGSHDTVLSLTTFSFDIFVLETISMLTAGARIVVGSAEEKLDVEAVVTAMVKEGVTILQMTPSQLSVLLAETDPAKALKPLRCLVVGGEVFTEQLAERVREFTSAKIFNSYGLTETAVYSTAKDVTPGGAVNIGKPIANTRIYMLGKDMAVQPLGVVGELCIAGAGVGRGYLNNQELTAKKFAADPHRPGQRMYRTGDLARWLPDGDIEFLGREDHQVKVRGFRIEPGEIENRLRNHPTIKEALVTAKETEAGDRQLYAYIVSTGTGENAALEDPARLRAFLLKQLPDYMIPSYFIQVDGIPLMPSGKVDKNALMDRGYRLKSSVEYEAPGNLIEEKLVEVWEEVLGIEKIGANDNFFQLGGDSVNAIQIAARLLKHNLKLRTIDIFLNPTVKAAAHCVEKIKREIDQSPVEGVVPLTPHQRRYLESPHAGFGRRCRSVLLHSRDGFDEAILREVFTGIVRHHDILRMVVESEADRSLEQRGNIRGIEGKLFDLIRVRLDREDDHAVIAAAEIEKNARVLRESIDLNNGPLVKLGLFNTRAGDYLLIVIHSLVVDEVSWGILLEDFSGAYRDCMAGRQIVFPKKTHSFQSWAFKLMEFSQTRQVLEELSYWKGLETPGAGKLQLSPEVEAGGDEETLTGAGPVVLELDESDTEKLAHKINWVYNTEPADLLLAALGMAVKECTGRETVAVELQGHGREPFMDEMDISRTVGCFTYRFPVLLDTGRAGDLSHQLPLVKEARRRVPNKGRGYDLLKDGPRPGINPEIRFNYPDGDIIGREAPGESGRDPDDPLFTVCRGSEAESPEPGYDGGCGIDITAAREGARLKLSFIFNPSRYDRRGIMRLAERFKASLDRITAHCMEKEQRELTPSDVGNEQISLDDFQRIKQLININQ